MGKGSAYPEGASVLGEGTGASTSGDGYNPVGLEQPWGICPPRPQGAAGRPAAPRLRRVGCGWMRVRPAGQGQATDPHRGVARIPLKWAQGGGVQDQLPTEVLVGTDLEGPVMLSGSHQVM